MAGKGRFTTDIGTFAKFDRINENVNPRAPLIPILEEKKKKKTPFGITNPLTSRRQVPSLRVAIPTPTETLTGSVLTVVATPRWEAAPGSPPSPGKSHVLHVKEIVTNSSTHKAYRVVDVVDEVPEWTSVPDTPMSPEERRAFFAPGRLSTPTNPNNTLHSLPTPPLTPLSATRTRPIARPAPYPNRRASMALYVDEFGTTTSNSKTSTGPTRNGRKTKTVPRGLRI
jgi:hypothetical protein